MKNAFSFLALVFLLCAIFLPISSVHGLSQNELTISLVWSKTAYYQGDSGSVTISLVSTCGDELEFSWVGIHFPWLSEGYYYALDLTSSPIRIPSQGSITFSPIAFSVPSDAPVGWNEYYVSINFREHHWYGWGAIYLWTSSSDQVYIHDAYEKTYNGLEPQVSSKIAAAQSANYESPDAKSLLSQALNEYNLAGSLANQGKWQDAVSHLQTASNLLTQASAKEEQYQLDSWRQKASDAIDVSSEKISQLANCESPDAVSLRSQAQIQLTDAQNSFNQATLQGYKNAYNYALQASATADQASIKEEQYQLDIWEQKASDSMNDATQKIDALINCESPDAKSLLQQAQTQFTNAQNSFNQATLQSYKNAYNSAVQAISLADQASVKEQAYQEQKRQQQQLILIGGGISIIAIAVIVGLVLRRRGKLVAQT